VTGLRIAITGLGTFLGQRLVRRWAESPAVERIVAIDRRPPLRTYGRVDFEEVDLCDPVADVRLAEKLERVDVFVHLAFRRFPSADHDLDHELETLGTLRVLNACAAAGVQRVVVQSSTMAYGARPSNPNFLDESHPLHGHPDAHNVQNRLEVERHLVGWRAKHPERELTVLRHCWVMGPTFYDRVVEFFESERPATVLGYDPLLQFVHEEDLVDAFEKAALESHPGVFNVVGKGVLPLATLLALADKRPRPVPRGWLYRSHWLHSEGLYGDPPGAFFDYLRYLWVADGARAWAEFGEPVYTTREAWVAFVASRKMRRYA